MRQFVGMTLAAAVIVAICQGCGATPEQVARGTVNAGGIALNEVDKGAADAYIQAADDALNASLTLEEYTQRMAPWDALVDSLVATETALRVAEDAVDAWDAGGQGEFLVLLGELVSAFNRLLAGLVSLGIDVPQELLDFLQMAGQLLPDSVEGAD